MIDFWICGKVHLTEVEYYFIFILVFAWFLLQNHFLMMIHFIYSSCSRLNEIAMQFCIRYANPSTVCLFVGHNDWRYFFYSWFFALSPTKIQLHRPLWAQSSYKCTGTTTSNTVIEQTQNWFGMHYFESAQPFQRLQQKPNIQETFRFVFFLLLLLLL